MVLIERSAGGDVAGHLAAVGFVGFGVVNAAIECSQVFHQQRELGIASSSKLIAGITRSFVEADIPAQHVITIDRAALQDIEQILSQQIELAVDVLGFRVDHGDQLDAEYGYEEGRLAGSAGL